MEAKLFRVKLSVEDTFNLIRKDEDAQLIDAELKSCGDHKIGFLVYEKYFIRVKSRVTLIVVVDDLDGYTKVKALGTGGGTAMWSDFDWGAGDSFENTVFHVLKEYIIKSH